MKHPLGLVGGVLLPAFGEAGADISELVGAREVPQHQPFEHGIAEEAHALIAVVRGTGGGGHVGGGHGDSEGAACQRRSGRQSEQQPRRDRHGGARRPKHACSPFGPLGRKKHETATAATIAAGDPRHPNSRHYAAAVGKGLAIRGAA